MLRLLLFAALAWLAVKLILYLRAPAKRKRSALPRPPSAHQVLGIEPGASADEIRRAYQEKMRQYHPDKVASLGPELQEMAEQRSREINAAYRELRQED